MRHRPRDGLEDSRQGALRRGGQEQTREDRSRREHDERDRHHRRRLVGVLGLLAPRRSEEREEHEPADVERGQERAERAEEVDPRASGMARDLEDLVLGEEPGEREHAGQRERADDERPPRDRHPADQPAHPLQVGLLVHPVHHRAGAEEHQGLVERVGDEHEHRARVEAHARGHEHEPELADRGVRENPLDVVLGEGAGRGEQRRDEPHDQHHGERDARRLEEWRAPDDQVDARGHHRRGVDQRGDGRRAGHRIREPDVERHLRGLPDRAREQKERDRRRGVLRDLAGLSAQHLREVERAELRHDQREADQHRGVADPGRDERLLRRARVLGLLEPEPDQQVRAKPDALPAHIQKEVVVRQDQQEHEEHEEVQVGEEAAVPRIAVHIADRVHVDQQPDAGDDQDHRCRQHVQRRSTPTEKLPTEIQSKRCWRSRHGTPRFAGTTRRRARADAAKERATAADAATPAKRPRRPPDEEVDRCRHERQRGDQPHELLSS